MYVFLKILYFSLAFFPEIKILGDETLEVDLLIGAEISLFHIANKFYLYCIIFLVIQVFSWNL